MKRVAACRLACFNIESAAVDRNVPKDRFGVGRLLNRTAGDRHAAGARESSGVFNRARSKLKAVAECERTFVVD